MADTDFLVETAQCNDRLIAFIRSVGARYERCTNPVRGEALRRVLVELGDMNRILDDLLSNECAELGVNRKILGTPGTVRN